MSAPPYMKLFWGDYHKATRHLTRDQHGAYFLLIGEAWRLGGALPDDDAKLAAWALCTIEEWSVMRPIIMDFFALRRGKWWHDRVREELAAYESTSRKRKEAGKKGGSASGGKAKRNEEANACLLPTKPEPEPKSDNTPSSPPRGTISPKVTKGQVEAVWSACPQKARERSSRADVEQALGGALRRGHSPDAVLPGLLAAYRSDTYAGDRAKGIHRLIEKDRWASFVETSTAPPVASTTFDGPPALRDSVAREQGEDFVRRWLDHYCRWRSEDRTIIARTPLVAATLEKDLAAWLERTGVKVEVEAANDQSEQSRRGAA